MKMLKRLRYLMAEGFEVGNISCYDAPAGSDGPGRGKLTYVRINEGGERRLLSEEFEVTGREAERCSKVFLKARGR